MAGNGLEANQNGLLFFGTTGQDNVPFSGGTLCVLAPHYRLLVKNSRGSGACTGSLLYTLAEYLAEPIGGPLVIVGQVVNSQLWFRDPSAAQAAGLANGLEFHACPSVWATATEP